MKTSLTYGVLMAIAIFLFTIVLSLLGLHSDVAKLATAQWVGTIGVLVIGSVCTVYGVRARRETVPAGEAYTYGQAVGAGVTIALIASAIGIVTSYIYFAFINPAFADILAQAQLDKMAARGMSSAQIDRAEPVIRFMLKPAVQAVMSFGFGMIFGVIVSLIVAAFLKRPAPRPSQ
jgi:hypothetical protein